MDDAQFREFMTRLDAIVKLLALNLPGDLTIAERISVLKEAGFRNVQIAQILGTTPGYVNVALSREKKREGKSHK
jgi:DNA-binding CsgD family transcriptional regulator